MVSIVVQKRAGDSAITLLQKNNLTVDRVITSLSLSLSLSHVVFFMPRVIRNQMKLEM